MASELMYDIPPHVAPDHVYDFDFIRDPIFMDSLALGDIHGALLKLNEDTPEIFYAPRYGGRWFARSYDACYEIAQDTALFASGLGLGGMQLLPISSNPPEHETYRRALLQTFSPANVNAMLPLIQSMATGLVDAVAAKGQCEFVSEVAEPMPVVVFMNMLGLPLEAKPALRKIVVASMTVADIEEREALYGELIKHIDPVIDARLAKRENDMISRLLDTEVFGRQPNRDELRRYLVFLATAGLDTVVNALAFSTLHLAKDIDLQRQLRAEPSLIPEALEEFLRRYSPSTVFRHLTRDVEFRGVSMRRGDVVALLLPAANLDKRYFPQPERIVLNRDAGPVTFGTGIHRCLGSHLARLELRTLLTEWLAKVPEFELDAEVSPVCLPGLVYTAHKLPLRWTVETGKSGA